MDNQNRKDETNNKISMNKTLNLVIDGFEHMTNPTEEIEETITGPNQESENNTDNTGNVTLI